MIKGTRSYDSFAPLGLFRSLSFHFSTWIVNVSIYSKKKEAHYCGSVAIIIIVGIGTGIRIGGVDDDDELLLFAKGILFDMRRDFLEFCGGRGNSDSCLELLL